MKTSTLIIVVILSLFAVYEILKQFGVFEFATQQQKVVDIITDTRKLNKQRKLETTKLQWYARTTELFRGILMNEASYENHRYYIERCNIVSEPLNRRYTPEELRGSYALPFFLSLFLIPVSLIQPILIVVPVVMFFRLQTYQTIFRAKIRDEDEIIDDYFLDLYLLLYSQLRQGSRARLQGTVEQYIATLESQSDNEVRETMLKLARYMLNLLSLYEDHVAIPKLRDTYRSATIINFCNVATQSLNGVDNFDNLLTFKMQLVQRKTEVMRKRQQKILAQGRTSILAIWIILFIFIGVGWYSKMPTDMFKAMF